MLEKEAKERAKDFTDNKERQAAYECGFLDGADRMRGEMQKQGLALQSDMDKTIYQNIALRKKIEKIRKLEEDNADLKQSLDWANERESEDCKRIAELEEQISVLLSCKNCPENKGGFICKKEYENKCLAQKIQYIKELEQEKCELLGIIQGKDKANEWHDLQKDPDDLPKDTNSLYLVRVYSWDFGLSHLYKRYGTYIPVVCEWNGEYFKPLNKYAYENARNIKNCFAWKEIILDEEE